MTKILPVTMGTGMLRLLGPCVHAELGGVNTERRRPVNIMFDTGASRSHIAGELAKQLRLQPLEQVVPVTWADREAEYVPQYACAIAFPEPIGRLELNLAAASHLSYPDYGVLIGRDVLRESKLVVDFLAGVWEWHLGPSEESQTP